MFAVLFPALAYAGPFISFENELHDFGFVTQGILLEHAFEFTNVGTEELLIERLTPS